jgi:kumamolisin
MSTTPTDLNEQIMISVYLKRDTHENGMTLQEYTDGVIAGTQPILDHDAFVYQFGTVDDYITTVTDWATTNNLTVVSTDKGTATVKLLGTAGQYNTLFNITLETVVETDRTYTTYTGTLIIPNEINDVVDMILGLDNSMQVTSRLKGINVTRDSIDPTPSITSNLAKVAVTPVQVATAYQLPPGNGNGQCIAIIEFQGSGWNQTDVNRTFAQVGQTPPTVTNYAVDGATFTTYSDAETMMDIYCAGAVAPKAKIVVYYAPNTSQGFYDMVNAIANDNVNNPSVLTVSWGYSGDYTDYLATPFLSCIVKGILTFFSSGDDGGNNWEAEYPASSRYVIAAGGTSIFLNSNNSLNSEEVWSGSGGGISRYNTQQAWQTSPTLHYSTFSKASVLSSPITVTMRGVPDFSAPADPYTGYVFYVNGATNQNGGTSASAPFLAGMFARLNALLGRRIQFNEIMGLLYGNPSSTCTDVTVGYNNFSWHGKGNVNAYAATSGWDACTGLGSPIGSAIYKAFNVGSTFPKLNYGFRPSTGAVYPRRISGVR